eukprot:Sspe_Gene.118117::Locus_110857_Transcript_1_1_Confidence_1.000_Length_747::g.118117::m.118117
MPRNWQPPSGPLVLRSGPPQPADDELEVVDLSGVVQSSIVHQLSEYMDRPEWKGYWSEWFLAKCPQEVLKCAGGSGDALPVELMEAYRMFLEAFEEKLMEFCHEEECTEVQLLDACQALIADQQSPEKAAMARLVIEQSDFAAFVAMVQEKAGEEYGLDLKLAC